ncbi:MAG: bifunctional oligoribonuclease/PAP phosphatase NrnA [Clostridia bacterium]|nr:bifunctional oligoribonuclease/PAP phosphatase NrnA [Clostridia bacterium]
MERSLWMTKEMKTEFPPEMLSALKNANSILLCCHISPDGDAIGSLLSTGLALRALGKQVTMACGDAVPAQFRFLPCAGEVVEAEALKGKQFDAAMAVDTATLERMGACAEAFLAAPVTMQIDHHGDNPGYTRYNVVDGKASAAGCLVRRLLRELNVDLTKEIASCLYCAISMDTGNFVQPNTTPEAFEIMAELMQAGLDLEANARALHLLRAEPSARLLGKALNSLKIFGNGQCACMKITARDYWETHALPEHNANIVNYALNIPGVCAVFLAEERKSGEVKASLRSVPPLDVSVIARKYGGGGHKQASGLRYPGRLEALCESLEKDLEQLVEDNR